MRKHGESVCAPIIDIGLPGRHFLPIAKATTVDPFRVKKYFPPGTQVDDHDARSCYTDQYVSHKPNVNMLPTLISLNPALVSFSFTDLTAWNGVGDALTNDRKSLAAVLMLTGAIVDVEKLRRKMSLHSMYSSKQCIYLPR